ncbi:MAG: hypothetical protein HY553_23045 [Elusimicrobia bacterium]|nr:hypothetical protein [Elusimicrobiota bacterium]
MRWLSFSLAALPLGAFAFTTGCGAANYVLGGRPEAVVQADLKLPKGTRVAVIPLTLYGYTKENRRSVGDKTYAACLASMLKAGFHVVERSLVEKAVDEYSKNKRFDKTPGAQGAVYQQSDDEEDQAIIDLVDVGRTLNARLVSAGSMQLTTSLLSSSVEVRLRVTDVTTGEMVANCEAAGSPNVLETCAESMAQQLSVRMIGVPSLNLR